MTEEMKKRFKELGLTDEQISIIAHEWEVKEESEEKTVEAPRGSEDLELLRNEIEAHFGKNPFQNKDLGDIGKKFGLSPRQMPSRLSKMLSNGFLEEVGSFSPKKYKIR